MIRVAKWLVILVVSVAMSGCFSGGDVVDKADDTGLTEDDAGEGADASSCSGGQSRCGSRCVDDERIPDGGCVPGCEQSSDGVEICDGLDNDCDGEVDEDAEDAQAHYVDADGDGYGTDADSVVACEPPEGYAAAAGDCDDADAAVHPDADEVCDGVDNNCDGQVDGEDAADVATWHADRDGDGFGDPDDALTRCVQPSAYVERGGDCDDSNSQVHPDADEVCADDVDNDCDGETDDGSAVDAFTVWVDCDGDGYAVDGAESRSVCEKPAPASECSHPDADWTETPPSEADDIDCNDDEPAAHAKQWRYFDEPMDGTSFTERWDYSCDGTAERKWTATGGNCDWQCNGQSGWSDDTAPSCGEAATYVTCFEQFGQCNSSSSTRTQECR